jgi:hypothetical protein
MCAWISFCNWREALSSLVGTSLWDTITNVPSLAWGQLTVTPVMLFVPLGLYMLFLANMHLNDRPTLVRATRDFCYLLAGLAGVLFLGIPGTLSRLYEVLQLRSLANIGSRSIFQEPAFWTGVFGAYFVLVVGLAALELLHRRKKTYLYHLNQSRLKTLLGEVFDHADVVIEFHADRDSATLAFPDFPETQLTWKFKPYMGLCILDWGSTPESIRTLIEQKFENIWLGPDYTSSLVPGAIFMGLGTVMIVGSMGISLMQLILRLLLIMK